MADEIEKTIRATVGVALAANAFFFAALLDFDERSRTHEAYGHLFAYAALKTSSIYPNQVARSVYPQNVENTFFLRRDTDMPFEWFRVTDVSVQPRLEEASYVELYAPRYYIVRVDGDIHVVDENVWRAIYVLRTSTMSLSEREQGELARLKAYSRPFLYRDVQNDLARRDRSLSLEQLIERPFHILSYANASRPDRANDSFSVFGVSLTLQNSLIVLPFLNFYLAHLLFRAMRRLAALESNAFRDWFPEANAGGRFTGAFQELFSMLLRLVIVASPAVPLLLALLLFRDKYIGVLHVSAVGVSSAVLTYSIVSLFGLMKKRSVEANRDRALL